MRFLSEGQFTVLGGISFAKHLSLGHLVAFADDRPEVDAGILVGADELCQFVTFDIVFKADELFDFIAGVADDDFLGIHVFNDTVAFGVDQDA